MTSDERWPELPDVPTIRESGFADCPTYQWFILLAPVKTPAAVIDKLNATINTGLQVSGTPGKLGKAWGGDEDPEATGAAENSARRGWAMAVDREIDKNKLE